jgi:hypothetical protein
VKHYSIQAIDIFIDRIAASNGWHCGETLEYSVNNCAWESRIQLQLTTSQNGFYELQGKQIYINGDYEKMLHDQSIALLALQNYLYQQEQSKHKVRLLAEEVEVNH